MADFLSDAWVEELDAAARRATQIPQEVRLVVQQVVTDGPAGDDREVAYAVHLREGTASVTPGHAEGADVTFTQDRATAAAIARGELSAQAAFLEGRLRVGGDLRAALEQARAMAAISDVFAEVRATTTW